MAKSCTAKLFFGRGLEVVVTGDKERLFSFREEKEWRLLTTMPEVRDALKFETTENAVRPYVERPVDRNENPISTIMLGPKNQTPRNVVEKFLEANGFEDISIDRSDIPYR